MHHTVKTVTMPNTPSRELVEKSISDFILTISPSCYRHYQINRYGCDKLVHIDVYKFHL